MLIFNAKKWNYFFVRRMSRIVHLVSFNIDCFKVNMRYYLKKIFKNDKALKYPKTLQFPVTNKCNLDCVMCNIHANEKTEIPVMRLKEILSDKIFKEINSVGINGGEPFMLNNLDEYICALLELLPSIKNIYIISNGTYTEKTIAMLKKIKRQCQLFAVYLTVSFSIDGYSEIHDRVRGVKGTFDKLIKTVSEIRKDKDLYCDNINFICTINSQNVYELELLESFAKKIGIDINYNIATDHERLKNYTKYQNYSLFSDEHKLMIASEFIHQKFNTTGQVKYFTLFKYLTDKEHIRLDNCSNLKEAITLTANGDICFCATHSKILGNVLNEHQNIKELYFGNQQYNDEIKKNFCKHCSHYVYGISEKNYKLLIKEKMRAYHLIKF